MDSKDRPTELRARIRQTPDGLFLAEYTSEIDHASSAALKISDSQIGGTAIPAAPDMPDSHLGGDKGEVKMWVEQMAKGMGYSRVVWQES